jgi:hypothetical protein
VSGSMMLKAAAAPVIDGPRRYEMLTGIRWALR